MMLIKMVMMVIMVSWLTITRVRVIRLTDSDEGNCEQLTMLRIYQSTADSDASDSE